MTEDEIIQQLADKTTAAIADNIWTSYEDLKVILADDFEPTMADFCREILNVQYSLENCDFINAALLFLIQEEGEEDNSDLFPFIKAAIAWYLLQEI